MKTEPGGRRAEFHRKSSETDIDIHLNLDGSGQVLAASGYGMFDHMLHLLCFWAGLDLEMRCRGDLEIDAHHTLEDTGLCLGSALLRALGDRAGIARVGFGRVPMDESLTECSIDLSGRPWLEWRGAELLPPVIAGEEKDLWREFYKAFASAGKFNLHIAFLYGKNGHHLLESAAKSAGVALRQAIKRDGDMIKSTKGGLD